MIRLSNSSFRGIDGSSSEVELLSKFQRIMLASDGSMTTLLEEITGENLCASKILEELPLTSSWFMYDNASSQRDFGCLIYTIISG